MLELVSVNTGENESLKLSISLEVGKLLVLGSPDDHALSVFIFVSCLSGLKLSLLSCEGDGESLKFAHWSCAFGESSGTVDNALRLEVECMDSIEDIEFCFCNFPPTPFDLNIGGLCESLFATRKDILDCALGLARAIDAGGGMRSFVLNSDFEVSGTEDIDAEEYPRLNLGTGFFSLLVVEELLEVRWSLLAPDGRFVGPWE